MNAIDLASLVARVELLEGRQEIQQVVGRLCRAQDRHDVAAIESCYFADGYDDHLVFRGSPKEFAPWLVEVLADRFEETLHFVGPTVVEFEGDVAQANTECIAHHIAKAPEVPLEPGRRLYRTDYVLGLRYLDRFERRDGKWLIAHRRCVWDWAYHSPFEGSIKDWADVPDVIWGRKDGDDLAYEPVPQAPASASAVRHV